MLEILESEGDIVVVWKMPKRSTKDQLLWRIACELEQLVGEQEVFCEEVARIWESSKRTAGILQELVNQTKASSDTMELFVQGEHLLRTQEMGKLEGPEEAESGLRRHHRRWVIRSREKEMELEQEPEVAMEVAPEVAPEAVPETDVEMTLQ